MELLKAGLPGGCRTALSPNLTASGHLKLYKRSGTPFRHGTQKLALDVMEADQGEDLQRGSNPLPKSSAEEGALRCHRKAAAVSCAAVAKRKGAQDRQEAGEALWRSADLGSDAQAVQGESEKIRFLALARAATPGGGGEPCSKPEEYA